MATKLLAFPVDVRVIASAEIDSFKGALPLRHRIREPVYGSRAILLDDKDMSWWQLVDVIW